MVAVPHMMRMEGADEVLVLETDRNGVGVGEGGRNCWVLGHCSRVQDHSGLARDVRVQDQDHSGLVRDDHVQEEAQEVV